MPSRSVSAGLACVLSAGALAVAAPAAQSAPGGSGDPGRPLGQRSINVADVITETIAGLQRQVPGLAGKSTGQGWSGVSALADSTGTTHVRLERTYRGLPVLGGDLVVHQDRGGKVLGVDQTLRSAPSLNTTPRVSSERAGTATQRGLGSGQKIAKSRPHLAVDATRANAAPRLVWSVPSSGMRPDGTPSRRQTYVDALTGAVVGHHEQIQTEAIGSSLYAGQVSFATSGGRSGFTMTDPTRGNSVTGDAKNKADGCLLIILFCSTAKAPAFTDADNRWGSGTKTDRASAAVDVAYGTQKTWDYFKSAHKRNGIFGDGRGALSRVHYGKNYVNAFWDGKKMTYGDGDGVNFGPLVSLDVTGHEMSHGVTENSARLTYSGESGGLNEATSDIFGTMVEFSAANKAQPGNYLIGEAFDLRKHQGFRRMDTPSKDGKSVDCWSASVKNLDVHYSSGVGNHFFYLLAEGSGSKTINGVPHSSSTCNGKAVTGIGRQGAAAIWYRALTTYMTSSTTYAGARTATLKAATDLFGATSPQYKTVAAAWSAVSVG